MKLKICSECGKECYLWKSVPKLCKFCANRSIKFTPITKESYDGKKLNRIYLDEYGLFEPLKQKPNQSTTKKEKSLLDLLKLATIVFNKWIRERDLETTGGYCISCGIWNFREDIQAGHYMPSTYSQLRFNEFNTNGECETCNCFNPNHLVGYRKNLINKIGIKKVEWLESHKIAEDYKWDKEQLLEIIKKYKILAININTIAK